jgi:hypothetical protein
MVVGRWPSAKPVIVRNTLGRGPTWTVLPSRRSVSPCEPAPTGQKETVPDPVMSPMNCDTGSALLLILHWPLSTVTPTSHALPAHRSGAGELDPVAPLPPRSANDAPTGETTASGLPGVLANPN